MCMLFISSALLFSNSLRACEGYLKEMHVFRRLSGHLLQILLKDRTQVQLSLLFLVIMPGVYMDFSSAASLSLDLERFIIDSIAVTKTISTSIDEVRKILSILDKLRLVLSTIITPGLNADVDSICYRNLGAFPSSAVAGLSRCVFSPWLRFSYDLQLELKH